MGESILITGNSSGLGLGLTRTHLENGAIVYGLSRRGCPDESERLRDQKCDLEQFDLIDTCIQKLLKDLRTLDIVYLNAGILGEVKMLNRLGLSELRQVMDVNVWANKVILDSLLKSKCKIRQVIAISTGATQSANIGWASYSISKVAFHKLIELYANEYRDTHFVSLAPGLVDTAMQDYLCNEEKVPEKDFPVVKKFREARGSSLMPSPETVAVSIIEKNAELLALPSGSYTDIRNM